MSANNQSRAEFVKSPYRIYLAGPFFNAAQIALMQELEAVLEASGNQYFSPRLSHANTPDEIKNPENARRVFDNNLMAMNWANVIVAITDWKMPVGTELRITGSVWSDVAQDARPVYKSGPLNIPDAGTVWELGYCYHRVRAGNMAAIIYNEQARKPNYKANLMMALTANEVVASPGELQMLLAQDLSDRFGRIEQHKGDIF